MRISLGRHRIFWDRKQAAHVRVRLRLACMLPRDQQEQTSFILFRAYHYFIQAHPCIDSHACAHLCWVMSCYAGTQLVDGVALVRRPTWDRSPMGQVQGLEYCTESRPSGVTPTTRGTADFYCFTPLREHTAAEVSDDNLSWSQSDNWWGDGRSAYAIHTAVEKSSTTTTCVLAFVTWLQRICIAIMVMAVSALCLFSPSPLVQLVGQCISWSLLSGWPGD
jgi:hypothetical protein